MAAITSTDQIPSWFFQEGRYQRLSRDSPYELIADALSLRRNISLSLERAGQADPELLEILFSDQAWFDTAPTAEIPKNSAREIENIEPLLVGGVIGLANALTAKNAELFSYVHQYKDLPDIYLGPGDVFVGLGINRATDREIIEEIKHLLPILRQQMEITNKPQRYRINEKIGLLFRWNVFEYLDLTLWAKSEGHSISDVLLAEAIDHRGHKEFTYVEISESVSMHAEHAISIEFFEQLDFTIRNK